MRFIMLSLSECDWLLGVIGERHTGYAHNIILPDLPELDPTCNFSKGGNSSVNGVKRDS